MSEMVIEQVVAHLRSLPDHLQTEVLAFAKQLKTSLPVGVSGKSLLPFAGTILLNDLHAMQSAIETDCGQVDLDEW